MIFIQLSLFFLYLGSTQGHCLHSLDYWQSLPRSQWPLGKQYKLICGEQWFDLIHNNDSTTSDSMLWLKTFQEVAVTSLNNHSLEMENKITIVVGILENQCINKTLWEEQYGHGILFTASLQALSRFNRGESGHPLCSSLETHIHVAQLSEIVTNSQREEEVYHLTIYMKLLLFTSLVIITLLVIILKRMNTSLYNPINTYGNHL